jgi:hypothetical protein
VYLTLHPYVAEQLVNERIDRLRADAWHARRARPLLARWRSDRAVEPAADLGRVVPASPPRSPRADRAA